MNIVLKKTEKKSSLSNAQKTFNRLKKKIEKLQQEREETENILEENLAFYYKHLEPLKKEMLDADVVSLKVIYGYDIDDLRAKEKQLWRDVVTCKLNQFLDELDPNDFAKDDDLCVIFEDIYGYEYEETAEAELEEMKEMMEQMFKSQGVDVDLSDIDIEDSEELIMHKLFGAVGDAFDKQMEEENGSKPHSRQEKAKSKKALEKEKKARDLEELQKKGLAGIYKQLAKVLHPDLEQDPLQKIEKVKLMKKLTTAYENDDLHTLLTLEMEWIHCADEEGTNGVRLSSDEQIKIYNSILKDQLDALENNFTLLCHSPRYFPIHDYLSSDPTRTPKSLMLRDMQQWTERKEFALQIILSLDDGPEGLSYLRNLLNLFHRSQKKGGQTNVKR